jgi:hypothetical protein
VQGTIRPLPHAYVPPLTGGDAPDPELAALLGGVTGGCLACGMPTDGLGPRDERLHP